MKKITLLAMMLVGFSQTAFAGKKEAAEMLYRNALPTWKIPAVVDSQGCLWGLAEEHGVLVPVRITDGGKEQFCRSPKK